MASGGFLRRFSGLLVLLCLLASQSWGIFSDGFETPLTPGDRDRDGIPDAIEPSLGLDPRLVDTDGDGIPDGDEDFDRDNLINRGEIALGSDPANRDSDGDGILDGDENSDTDSLLNGREIDIGSNPFNADSDGDGWRDDDEVLTESDPTDANSRPPFTLVGAPRVRLFTGSGRRLPSGDRSVVVVAGPAVKILSPEARFDPAEGGVIVGQPPNRIEWVE